MGQAEETMLFERPMTFKYKRRRKRERNIHLLVSGIMGQKFAFEGLSTCVALLAVTRFDGRMAITMLALLTASFAIVQSIGASLAPRLRAATHTSRVVMSSAVWVLAGLVGALLLLEALTGGGRHRAGSWPVVVLIPVYVSMGLCWGVLEGSRRQMPQEILGSRSKQRQRLEALIHLCYEAASTAGALAAWPLTAWLGSAYGLAALPVCFGLSGLCYHGIDLSPTIAGKRDAAVAHPAAPAADRPAPLAVGEETKAELPPPGFLARFLSSSASTDTTCDSSGNGQDMGFSAGAVYAEEEGAAVANKPPPEKAEEEGGGEAGVCGAVRQAVAEYLQSLRVGSRIVFSKRKFTWLLFGYTLPFILHRLLEGVIFPAFAITILQHGPYSAILLGSSNMGELVGALMVMMLGKRRVQTPLPYVRWDAAATCLLWALVRGDPSDALGLCFSLFVILAFVSAGWAASNVSIMAYIESQMGLDYDEQVEGVSPLLAVMSVLHTAYLLAYALAALAVGRVFDYYIALDRAETGFYWVCGIVHSVCGALIFISTFVPPGSWALNPKRPEITFAWECPFNPTTPKAGSRGGVVGKGFTRTQRQLWLGEH